MIRDWKAPILAVVGLVSLAVAIPMGVANAQSNDQGQRAQAGGFQGGPPQQGGFQGGVAMPSPDGMMQRQMMMGGGPATMVTDNQFLYVLQGNMLYKINKGNLEVVGQGSLPMPMPMQPGRGGFEVPGPGAAGARGGQRAGGGKELPPEVGTIK